MELKSYLGLLSYYSKFLPNLLTVLAPLYTSLKHQQRWQWKEPQCQTFKQSKQSSQVLVHFDPNLDIHLACDASDYGIGAVLLHVMPDGTEKPTGFTSRTLSETESTHKSRRPASLVSPEKDGLETLINIRVTVLDAHA